MRRKTSPRNQAAKKKMTQQVILSVLHDKKQQIERKPFAKPKRGQRRLNR